MRRCTILVVISLLFLFSNRSNGETITILKTVFDVHDVYDALDEFISTRDYAESAAKEMQSGRTPQPPDPQLIFGDKLSRMLDAGLKAVEGLTIPRTIFDTSGLPDLSNVAASDTEQKR